MLDVLTTLQQIDLEKVAKFGGSSIVSAAVLGSARQIAGAWRAMRARRAAAGPGETGDFRPEDVFRAVRYYVEPEVSSVDPAGRERDRLGTRERLFHILDRELRRKDSPPYLLLLSDSGMGKTTALLNWLARERRKRRGQPAVVLSCRNEDVLARMGKVAEPEKTILLLDALDEDPLAVVDPRQRIYDLFAAARQFRGVVITCRSQFFAAEEEITSETGIARLAVGPGDSHTWPLQKFYLVPLDDGRVRTYLRRRYAWWVWRRRRHAWSVLQRIGDLRARPLILAYVDDLAVEGPSFASLYDVYTAIVEMWLAREKRFVPDSDALRNFSARLAVDLYLHREERGGEHADLDQIRDLVSTNGIPLEEWQFSGRSLLVRSAVRRYRFAHRSFLEYFWVRALEEGDPACFRVPWTDLMTQFALERLPVLTSTTTYRRALGGLARALVDGSVDLDAARHVVEHAGHPHLRPNALPSVGVHPVSSALFIASMLEVLFGSDIFRLRGAFRAYVGVQPAPGEAWLWANPSEFPESSAAVSTRMLPGDIQVEFRAYDTKLPAFLAELSGRRESLAVTMIPPILGLEADLERVATELASESLRQEDTSLGLLGAAVSTEFGIPAHISAAVAWVDRNPGSIVVGPLEGARESAVWPDARYGVFLIAHPTRQYDETFRKDVRNTFRAAVRFGATMRTAYSGGGSMASPD